MQATSRIVHAFTLHIGNQRRKLQQQRRHLEQQRIALEQQRAYLEQQQIGLEQQKTWLMQPCLRYTMALPVTRVYSFSLEQL